MSQLGQLSGSPGELKCLLASGFAVVTLDLLIDGYDSDTAFEKTFQVVLICCVYI